jgi:pyruvate ferredoxin oxidoreductase beta subunit
MAKKPLISKLAPGHRGCGGCGAAIAVKLILEGAGDDVIVCSPTGCVEVFTTPYPESAWEVPWIHSLFENSASVAAGIERALRALGNDHTKVLVIAGDGSTFDIGFGAISGVWDRKHDVTYVCYDNEAYMNTGIQMSGATPYGAYTTTTPPGRYSLGKQLYKKNMPEIAVAHGCPYVATASIAHPRDVIRKVKKAVEIEGPTYVQIHSTCCTGWHFSGELAVEVARLAVETGLYPLIEFENGVLTKVYKIKERKPVEEYLKVQGRFKHLFVREEGKEVLSELQRMADLNVKKYGLE